MGITVADLSITTDAFEVGGRIPDRIAVEGGNQQPRLAVHGVPADAVELAVIMHDPDAPMPHGFTHWLLYGPPAESGDVDPSAARVGTNSAGDAAWMGPRPPVGHGDHRYYFWVYALSRPVEGEPSREEFLDAYGDAVLEQNRIVGTYSR
ncbi:YbhB/YbcL family Raf kinase inhibitor-like protein [Agrococcus baldri]|uniref:PEBP family protein n=1 Tax=Agrococcus baldri TaxID=153730 RepID=A0AA87UW64_9MICO|nr:YbhB/YbcL family Raf kinase inhibitor-like protein [Agrococcus baldri]GEK79187.1 PEBP family protein [Agrococcus baldri]